MERTILTYSALLRRLFAVYVSFRQVDTSIDLSFALDDPQTSQHVQSAPSSPTIQWEGIPFASKTYAQFKPCASSTVVQFKFKPVI